MTARIPYKNYAVDASGDTISGAAVEVRRTANNALATLYAAATGATTLTNPFNAGDGDPSQVGEFEFWVDPGEYQVTVGTSPTDDTRIVSLLWSDLINYDSRSALAADVADGVLWPNGTVISDGTVFYKASTGATDIADLAGLVPFASISPDHFAENTAPGTTDMSAAVQAAVDYAEANFSRGADIRFGSGVYAAYGIRVRANGIGFSGTPDTRIRNNSDNDYTLHFEAADSLTTLLKRNFVRQLTLVYEPENPTAGAHIKAVRAQVSTEDVTLEDHFRGIELHGTDQGCHNTRLKIVQGSNTTGLSEAANGSCAIALLRAEVARVSTVSAGVGYSDPAAPSAVVDVWDATSGSFPAGAADTETYRVSVAGTVDGVTFAVGDYLQAITASPSTTTYAANWEKTAVLGYYTEPNVATFSQFDIGNNNYGMQTCVLATCGDGIVFSDGHMGFARESIVEFSPVQSVIDFTSYKFSNVFFDPTSTWTKYGIFFTDRYSTGQVNTLGNVMVVNSIFGSPLENGIYINSNTAVDRLLINGNTIKNAGKEGILCNSAGSKQLVVTNNNIFNAGRVTTTSAAIRIGALTSGLIDNNSISATYYGINILAPTGSLFIGEGNTFTNAPSGGRMFLIAASTLDTLQVPQRSVMSAEPGDSATQASATALNIPVGRDFVTVTGSNTVDGIRAASPNSSINGREVLLTFTASLTVTHTARESAVAGDIVLASGTDFSATAGAFLRLQCISGVWYEVTDSTAYRPETILGTVSQASGVPTGAVIERGSNANGKYVRFADGTQICTMTLAAGASASAVWTFPIPFIGAGPAISVTPASSIARFTGTSGSTTTTASFDAWASDGTTRVAIFCRLSAIGEWF